MNPFEATGSQPQKTVSHPSATELRKAAYAAFFRDFQSDDGVTRHLDGCPECREEVSIILQSDPVLQQETSTHVPVIAEAVTSGRSMYEEVLGKAAVGFDTIARHKLTLAGVATVAAAALFGATSRTEERTAEAASDAPSAEAGTRAENS